MRNIKPIGTRVLIESLPTESKTESGLILSDNPTGKPVRGMVLAIGVECKLVSVKDEVLYNPNSGTVVNDCLILDENNILAII
tara:strand:- start:467 stop:715 length:249 start_codon:yes stop_codon:yes gene_type:complete